MYEVKVYLGGYILFFLIEKKEHFELVNRLIIPIKNVNLPIKKFKTIIFFEYFINKIYALKYLIYSIAYNKKYPSL